MAQFYSCDECGYPRRILTLHATDGTESHFCSVDCLQTWAVKTATDAYLGGSRKWRGILADGK